MSDLIVQIFNRDKNKIGFHGYEQMQHSFPSLSRASLYKRTFPCVNARNLGSRIFIRILYKNLIIRLHHENKKYSPQMLMA